MENEGKLDKIGRDDESESDGIKERNLGMMKGEERRNGDERSKEVG